MFDISKVSFDRNSREGVWHDVLLPGGAPAGFRWRLRGAGSEQVVAVYANAGNVDDLSEAEMEKTAVDAAVAATTDIEGLMDGETPVSPSNCRKVLEEHSWLVAQLLEVVGDTGKFVWSESGGGNNA